MSETEKIFCIGLPKTGTTSIGDALEILGYKRLGWEKKISTILTMRWHEGNIPGILEYTEQYQAFEDVPWCMLYKEMDEQYPNAKFIISYRSSEDVWLESYIRHNNRTGPWFGNFLMYGSYDPKKDSQLYKNYYAQHLLKVRKHFVNRENKLLAICMEKGVDWTELTKFLGVSEIPTSPFPHSNKDLSK